jgi:hypothetical protein
MLKSNVSVKEFQVLIVLIQNDLWKVVVLHCGTSYFASYFVLSHVQHPESGCYVDWARDNRAHHVINTGSQAGNVGFMKFILKLL